MPLMSGKVLNERTTTAEAPVWAVLLTARQRWLLELCTDWHARAHGDVGLRREFVALTDCLRHARPAGVDQEW